MRDRPKYVSYYRDRHGVLRWRFRRPGYKESQTRELFGTEPWWAWYHAAEAQKPPPIGASRTVPGSIDALAVAYYESSEWSNLKPTTQRTYRGIIDRFRDFKVGDKRRGSLAVAQVDTIHLRRLLDRMADRPSAANNLLKILRVLLAFAVDRGWRADNPAIHVKKLKIRSNGFLTWSEDDIAKFEERWPLGTKERLAFDLLLYTAQRSGDVRQMGPQHARDGFLRVKQEKTGEELEIPIHPRLRASIDAIETQHLTYVVTKHAQPYSAKGFSQWVSEAATRAGLPKKASAHGLRKAAARRLAEAGCTVHMIMSITGHRSLKEVERYTRAAVQRSLATEAMRRVGGT